MGARELTKQKATQNAHRKTAPPESISFSDFSASVIVGDRSLAHRKYAVIVARERWDTVNMQ